LGLHKQVVNVVGRNLS